MNLENYSGLELGSKVNKKELKPREVIEYFADRIEKRNPSINAFVYTKVDEALREADELEDKIMSGQEVGPLAGVPICLKDFLPSKQGWPNTHGGVPAMRAIDIVDGEFYKAAHSLGAIAIGKTNAPAFGFRGTTDNTMYGPTSTPFKVGYNSGGSSGGTGAAVGDGLVPIGEGGDAGGSIRIPAAWCGCFGFKPSAGLVPSVCRPDAWTATHPYCCGGPITRTVEDAAVVLDKMISYNPRDPISIPYTGMSMLESVDRPVGDLKVAYTLDFDLFPLPDVEIYESLLTCVSQLPYIVGDVHLAKFDHHFTRDEVEEAWLRGISIDSSIDLAIDKSHGKDIIGNFKDQLPAEFIKWNDIAFNSNMMDYRKFHEIRTDILDAHLKIFEDFDIIIAPVTGCLPVPNAKDFNTTGPSSISGESINPLIGFGYTYLENMIGFPAASVPVGVSSNGLPIGLQVIGKRYHDSDVFALCGAIEHACDWARHYSIPFGRSI